jgi:hypothetical protein
VAIEEARAAVRDPSLTGHITDPELRLEVIRLNESRVDLDQHRNLQTLRRATLEGPGGAEAAKDLSKSTDAGTANLSIWKRSEEGPGLTLGVISDTAGRTGLRLSCEAGLRNTETAPRNFEARREVHFLGIEVDSIGTEQRCKVTLGMLDNERNLYGLFGGGSSGFEVGYIDRVNAEGTHGVYLESWSGLSARWGDSTWTGIRVIARADDLQNDTRLRLLPAITLSTGIGPVTLSGMLVSAQGEFGHRIEASTHQTPSTLSLSLERAPKGEQRLLASISRRF